MHLLTDLFNPAQIILGLLFCGLWQGIFNLVVNRPQAKKIKALIAERDHLRDLLTVQGDNFIALQKLTEQSVKDWKRLKESTDKIRRDYDEFLAAADTVLDAARLLVDQAERAGAVDIYYLSAHFINLGNALAGFDQVNQSDREKTKLLHSVEK